MDEVLTAVAKMLCDAGFEAAYADYRLTVNGAAYPVRSNYNGTITMASTQFRRSKTGQYNTRRMIRSIIQALPHRMRERDRVAAMVKLQAECKSCKDFVDRVCESSGAVRVNVNSEFKNPSPGVYVGTTSTGKYLVMYEHDEFTPVGMAVDFLSELIR